MSTYKSEFLQILHERGFLYQGSNLEGLDSKLAQGQQSAYIGFDATARSFHVGNLSGIMMLYWFQQCGHKPVTLMGGGTTKIGDPSGKDSQRKVLDDAAIRANIESLKGVFAKFLNYGEGETDALMVNNDDWLSDLNYIGFLRDYGRHFTINRMLSFESVKQRLDREQPLTFLEFNYMILQGYDFLELFRRYGTILQMGGSDQWGNILNGTDLIRRVEGEEAFALTCPLLTTASGAKMGKTADGAVWLNADMLSPYEYYQYWRNTQDADVGRFLKIFTTLPMDEIARLEALKGQEINEAKKTLAFEATKLCHGEDAAREAEETTRRTFEEGQAGEDLPTITVSRLKLAEGIPATNLFTQAGLSASNGEAKRLIKGGGAKINDQPVGDFAQTIDEADLLAEGHIKLSAGKKRHALIKVVD